MDISRLPHELQIEVLSHLPPEEVVRLAWVDSRLNHFRKALQVVPLDRPFVSEAYRPLETAELEPSVGTVLIERFQAQVPYYLIGVNQSSPVSGAARVYSLGNRHWLHGPFRAEMTIRLWLPQELISRTYEEFGQAEQRTVLIEGAFAMDRLVSWHFSIQASRIAFNVHTETEAEETNHIDVRSINPDTTLLVYRIPRAEYSFTVGRDGTTTGWSHIRYVTVGHEIETYEPPGLLGPDRIEYQESSQATFNPGTRQETLWIGEVGGYAIQATYDSQNQLVQLYEGTIDEGIFIWTQRAVRARDQTGQLGPWLDTINPPTRITVPERNPIRNPMPAPGPVDWIVPSSMRQNDPSLQIRYRMPRVADLL